MLVKLKTFRFMSNKKYTEIIYNEYDKPITNYPKKFSKYIFNRYNLKSNAKFLELGCGRGDFLNEFKNLGLDSYGIDISDLTSKKFPEIKFKSIDLLNQDLPFSDNYFDIVYSKSFIEHFYYPEKIFQEAHRVLKPNGILITLTPEWNYIYKSFYEDFTHRTPFTKTSIRDIQLISNFKEIKIESFKQLPILWNNIILKIPFSILSELTRFLIPDYFRLKNKWVRFSKEIMILSSAKK